MQLKHLALFVLLFGLAHADTVTMKNGDRLSGSIIRIDDGGVQFRSDVLGDVRIPKEKVDAVSSTSDVAVLLKDGSKVSGRIFTQPDGYVVDGETLRTQPLASVKMILSPDERTREERLEDPGWLQLWKGSFDTGLSAARGNTETTTINLALNATRVTRKDQLNLHGSALYARNGTQGNPMPIANAVRGGFKYDYNVDTNSFLFVLSDMEHDQFQKLNLRTVVGAGGGHHTIRNARTTLDFFAGGSMNRELFAQLHRTSAEALGGEEWAYKLTKNTALKEKLTVFPNLTQRGEFRVTLDSSAVTAINKWIGWQTSVSNRYLSNPIEGTSKNDVLLTTGFRFSFAR